jgi:hypothetical protein
MAAHPLWRFAYETLPSLCIDGMPGVDVFLRLCIARWKGFENQPFQSHAIEHIPCTPIVVEDVTICERHAHKEGFCRNVVRLSSRQSKAYHLRSNRNTRCRLSSCRTCRPKCSSSFATCCCTFGQKCDTSTEP